MFFALLRAVGHISRENDLHAICELLGVLSVWCLFFCVWVSSVLGMGMCGVTPSVDRCKSV